MKKIKLLLCIFLLLNCTGCAKPKIQKFDFIMFYADWCGICEAAKENFIPLLEKEFKDQINIIYYNIDTDEGNSMYEYYVGYIDEENKEIDGLLKDVDKEFKELPQFPLFIVDGEYGFFNWIIRYNEEFIQDIKKTFNNEKIDRSIYDEIYFFE